MGLKTKLTMAAITSAAGAAMIAGGTFALFSNTTANNGNSFTAGTVKIQDYTGKPVADLTQYFRNLAPGDSETRNVTIKNTGSLDAWIQVDVPATVASETGALFKGTTPLKLSFGADGTNTPVFVKSGDTVTFPVTYLFPRTAGNSYQNASGSVSVHFDAIQARNNGGSSAPIDNPDSSSVGNSGNFITPQDFSLKGWSFGYNDKYSGYSIGFALAKSTANISSITVDVYDNGKLLQENTSKPALLALNATTLSTPIENDAQTTRYSDQYWTYSNWFGSVGEAPTNAVITVTDKTGHVYSVNEQAH